MTKTLCDSCGKETSPGIPDLLIKIPIAQSPGNVTLTTGCRDLIDICPYCLIDAVNALDDRPHKPNKW